MGGKVVGFLFLILVIVWILFFIFNFGNCLDIIFY